VDRIVILDEIAKRMVSLYKEGYGCPSIGSRFQVSGNIVKRELVRKGIVLRKKGHPHTDIVRKVLADRQIGFKYSDESRKKMSFSHKGKVISKEQKEKIALSLLGKLKTKEAIEKTRLSHIGSKWSEETRKKINRNKSDDHKRKISESLKGRSNIALKGRSQSGKVKKEKSERMKLFFSTKEGRKKAANFSILVKKLWLQDDYVKKQILSRNIFPNKTEISFLSILNDLYPSEWKYVGDGQVIINGKCPDYININGQKKIIELFGDYWHKDQNPEDRKAIFAPFGYSTLVIWESELKDKRNLFQKLNNFVREEIRHEKN